MTRIDTYLPDLIIWFFFPSHISEPLANLHHMIFCLFSSGCLHGNGGMEDSSQRTEEIKPI